MASILRRARTERRLRIELRLWLNARATLSGVAPRLVAAHTFRFAVAGDVLDALGG